MFNLKKIKNISLIVVPEETSREPRSIRIPVMKLLVYSVIYTVIIFFLGFYLISFTPLSEALLPYSLRLTDSDRKKVEILNEKISILAREIEALKSVNKRLKFAIMLGDSSLFNDRDSSTESGSAGNPAEGNLLAVFGRVFGEIFGLQDAGITFIKPAEGFVSQKFSPDRGHFGVDFVMKENRPVFASAGGYVVFASYTTEYGYSLIINHTENYVTKYYHCSALLKKEGDVVHQGELVALSGNSGTESTGPHLHFEIWEDGKPVNPMEIFIIN